MELNLNLNGTYGAIEPRSLWSLYSSYDETMKNVRLLSEFDVLAKRPNIDMSRTIRKVIFNDPATIIFWNDGTKTVVKCVNEKFDPEKGLSMAIAKRFLGDKGNYYNTFTKWLPEKNDNVKKDLVDFGMKIIDNSENEDVCYLELPDGYRLKFENGKYAGRYDPNGEK